MHNSALYVQTYSCFPTLCVARADPQQNPLRPAGLQMQGVKQLDMADHACAGCCRPLQRVTTARKSDDAVSLPWLSVRRKGGQDRQEQ